MMVLEEPLTQPLVDRAPEERAVEQPGHAGLDGVPGALVLGQGEVTKTKSTMHNAWAFRKAWSSQVA